MTKSKGFFPNFRKLFTSSSSSSSSSKSNSSRDQFGEDLGKIAGCELKNFSYETLAAATQNFDALRKLGEGGFGPVYQGKLSDGSDIAVKRLSRKTSIQGDNEFVNEARLLSGVQHRNVVRLLGYCVSGEERLLVYEYVANQSLDKYMFKADKKELLDWKRRHDVIVGVAKGLDYLHEQGHGTIIHRDIKGGNILLDKNWHPKIADFGIARLCQEDETHVQTRVAGTNGYMAPEYFSGGNLTKKADVFSFGVMVLELISGEKSPTYAQDPDSERLVKWAFKLYRKQMSFEVMDPGLASPADKQQILRVIHIGFLCVQSNPRARPGMDHVVLELSKKLPLLEDVVANQMMAMIDQLQKEKAVLEMEKLQHQRMMVEHMNEVMVKERELEGCRKKLLEYETRENVRVLRMSEDGSSWSGFSSASCSNAEDSDGLSIDLSEEGKEDEDFRSPQEKYQNQSTPTPVVAVGDLEQYLCYFKEERMSILEELKVLEEKLTSLDDDDDDENGQRHLNCETTNSRKQHNHQDLIARHKGKSLLLPVFDAKLNRNEVHDSFHDESEFKKENKKLAVEDKYEKLCALEADGKLLEACVSSLKKGDKCIDLVHETLQHLRDRGNLELQLRNMDDGAIKQNNPSIKNSTSIPGNRKLKRCDAMKSPMSWEDPD